jgi:hypothetical protein
MRLKIMFILLVLMIFLIKTNASFNEIESSILLMKAESEASHNCSTSTGFRVKNNKPFLLKKADDLECVAQKIQDQFPERAQILREEAQ